MEQSSEKLKMQKLTKVTLPICFRVQKVQSISFKCEHYSVDKRGDCRLQVQLHLQSVDKKITPSSSSKM